MDWLSTLGFAMGSAWLSGLNLYLTVLTLGLLQRFGWAHLPGELSQVSNWWVIGISGGLFVIEFIADKIPAVDSVWQAIHTFIKIPAGAILAASAFGDFNPMVRTVAMLVGGTVALSSHGTKAVTRLGANTSPEPFSNGILSLLEDLLAFGSTILMVFHPVVILVIVVIFVAIAIWLTPKIFRFVRGVFRRFSGTNAAEQSTAAVGQQL
jgi:hypothetical protein